MNDIEHEGKILAIDTEYIRAKLSELNAKKVANYEFRRYVFDTIPENENRWVRLRSNGIETTLTVKEITSKELDGTYEWEVTVSDIDMTLTILEKIGIKPRGYQENYREEYELDGVMLSIDSWPKLQPYLEIEAEDVDTIVATTKKLGLDTTSLTGVNTEKLYADIGIDLKSTPELTFTEESKV